MTRAEAIFVLEHIEAHNGLAEEAKLMAIEALKQLEQRWIPCSERLPECDIDVLVTTDLWRIYIATKCWDGWLTDDSNLYEDDDIIAWMPLPTPYKREKTDGKTD